MTRKSLDRGRYFCSTCKHHDIQRHYSKSDCLRMYERMLTEAHGKLRAARMMLVGQGLIVS